MQSISEQSFISLHQTIPQHKTERERESCYTKKDLYRSHFPALHFGEENPWENVFPFFWERFSLSSRGVWLWLLPVRSTIRKVVSCRASCGLCPSKLVMQNAGGFPKNFCKVKDRHTMKKWGGQGKTFSFGIIFVQ